ncbi:MAG: hypothetical protein EZS28_053041 [Streblomastix strix]|uniref:Uncharacterized protein n=1 Tax=Streblomastix strix TaxID=222440 RepID=A0A5J4RM53_9EUKA|nr:MAG: hypothetical protein EZS28_053041 [Streblomastix strix]
MKEEEDLNNQSKELIKKRAEMEEKRFEKNKNNQVKIEFTFNNFLRSSRRKKYELDRQNKIDREENEEKKRKEKFDQRRRKKQKMREERKKRIVDEQKKGLITFRSQSVSNSSDSQYSDRTLSDIDENENEYQFENQNNNNENDAQNQTLKSESKKEQTINKKKKWKPTGLEFAIKQAQKVGDPLKKDVIERLANTQITRGNTVENKAQSQSPLKDRLTDMKQKRREREIKDMEKNY